MKATYLTEIRNGFKTYVPVLRIPGRVRVVRLPALANEMETARLVDRLNRAYKDWGVGR